MKEHFQDYGVRRWAGDNLIELQKEPLEAIQKLVEPYAPCILQGCEVNATEKRITPGMVALWELDENNRKKGVKIARFEGCVTQSFPVFLTLKRTTEERVYVDGKNKPVAYDYTAQNTTVENDVKDMFPLKITATGGPRLAESLTVNFTAATERENIQPNETLGTAFGKIRKWFSDLKALAFKEKVAQTDFDGPLTNAFNNKVDKDGTKVLSECDFTQAYKDKLENIAAGANKYTHPTSAAGAKTSGFYKIETDANGHITAVTSVIKEDITCLGIPEKDTVYTHPTGSGYKHIPSGGSSGQYLKRGTSSGTAVWATPVASEIGAAAESHSHDDATQSDAGFMSADDKKKLDGITAGANKYTHPTSAAGAKSSGFYKITTDANGHITAVTAVTKADITGLGIPAQDTQYTHPTNAGNKHIPNYGSSGQYLKYSAQGTAAWASPASNLATTSDAGFMSANDKKDLDAMIKCKVAGVYMLYDNIVEKSSGIAVTCGYATNTNINAKCIRLKLTGGTTGKFYLAFVSAPYQYRVSTNGGAPAGGEVDIFIRNDKGEYIQSYYNLTVLLIEIS